jgi:hypothetical protein
MLHNKRNKKMGQRHQVYVVIKRNGKYTCVAAVHNQWSYGRLALNSCHNTIRIIKASKTLVQNAVDQATEQGSKWLSMLVAVCQSYDRAFPIDIPDDPFDDDNNDGITVIDITDVDNPAYCFNTLYHYDKGKNLTSEEYMELYEDEHVERTRKALDDMKEYPLVDISVLQEVWPNSAWDLTSSFKKQEDSGSKVEVVPAPVESLLEKTVRKMTESKENSLLEFPEDLKELAMKMVLTGKVPVHTLARVIPTDLKELDLSHCKWDQSYVKLTADGISKASRIEILNISGWKSLDDEALVKIGSSCRWIKMLVIFGCGRITGTCFSSLEKTCPLLQYLYSDIWDFQTSRNILMIHQEIISIWTRDEFRWHFGVPLLEQAARYFQVKAPNLPKAKNYFSRNELLSVDERSVFYEWKERSKANIESFPFIFCFDQKDDLYLILKREDDPTAAKEDQIVTLTTGKYLKLSVEEYLQACYPEQSEHPAALNEYMIDLVKSKSEELSAMFPKEMLSDSQAEDAFRTIEMFIM